MSEVKLIKVKLVTPSGGECEFECESLRMKAQDNAKGNGGGGFGVRYGHAAALAALDKGALLAFNNGKLTKKLYISGGFAQIRHDSVVVITDSYEAREDGETDAFL